MNKLLMKLLLLGIAGAIYLLTGRNRRQIEKIPEEHEPDDSIERLHRKCENF